MNAYTVITTQLSHSEKKIGCDKKRKEQWILWKIKSELESIMPTICEHSDCKKNAHYGYNGTRPVF